MVRTRPVITLAVMAVLACVAPEVATAASERPSASTGGASAVQQTTATVRAAVRPNGAKTTYAFQYGTTRKYELTTPETAAGSGTKLRKVAAALAGLAPATTYHYRVVARNAKGTTRGEDRTFKTDKQPLGLVLTPDANPLAIDQPLLLSGQLSGTGNGGRTVQLQYKPFPYVADWASVPGVNDLVTDPQGLFAFRIGPVAFNTQLRVALPDKPKVASPIVAIGVKPRVSTAAPRQVKRSGPRKRVARFRIRGTITPNRDGSQVLVQKLVRGTWTTIAATTATRRSDTESGYRVRLRQRHGGRYRVIVNPIDGAFVANAGREVRVRVRRG